MNPEAFLIVRKMMNCFDIYVNLFIDFFNEGIKNEFHILIHFETENNSGMNQVILARDCKTKLRLLWDLKDYNIGFSFPVLQYEPNNSTAKEFYPLILEKLQQSKYDVELHSTKASQFPFNIVNNNSWLFRKLSFPLATSIH